MSAADCFEDLWMVFFGANIFIKPFCILIKFGGVCFVRFVLLSLSVELLSLFLVTHFGGRVTQKVKLAGTNFCMNLSHFT